MARHSLSAFSISLLMTTGAAAADVLVVTGERRPQASSEIAQSITVLDQDQLAFIDADHIAEALARVPGVFISSRVRR